MRILVFGDTHMPKKGSSLPEELQKAFSSADLIIHTGDWQTVEVYEKLKADTSVIGVYGNGDEKQLQADLPAQVIMNECGYRIAVVHGHEGKGSTTEKRAENAFKGKADIILFGHSHIPYLRYHGKSLLLNPGSATDRRRSPYFSFAWLRLSEEGIKAEHVFFL
ncbi:metallophosphoesterase family protein [Alkalicoccus halolimnae]|uniref:Phosphoesterase n=1 Tax=Alkalicoccus halolimnae TaxID=1667239 RepID=A0A5C7F061_9BACI|nr:metallophosphoesterase family protein [Alkalicoccus halolimnae]TXF82507.1 YfcE family phosphodiesterase [Alkalicoccus halolimnae]